jgi:hypothetical protein
LGWFYPMPPKTGEYRHYNIDVNFWKTHLHNRLMRALGDPGGIDIYGTRQVEHRLIADHVAASEKAVRTFGHGREVDEWQMLPGKPDNHWFDCLVGCCAAADMCGIGSEHKAKSVKTKFDINAFRNNISGAFGGSRRYE